MAILKSKDGSNILLECSCTCGEGIRIKVNNDDDNYFLISYTNSNFNTQQDQTFWRVFCKKIKKIWCIIRNKDYYYSEICMTKNDFEEFREYIDSIE